MSTGPLVESFNVTVTIAAQRIVQMGAAESVTLPAAQPGGAV